MCDSLVETVEDSLCWGYDDDTPDDELYNAYGYEVESAIAGELDCLLNS